MNSYNHYGPASHNAPHPNNGGPHSPETDPRHLQRHTLAAHEPHYPNQPSNFYPHLPTNLIPGRGGFAQRGAGYAGGFVPPARGVGAHRGGLFFQAPSPNVGQRGGVPQPTRPSYPYGLHHMQSMPPLPQSSNPLPPTHRHRSLTSPPLPPKPPQGPPFPGRQPISQPPTLPPKIPLYPLSIPGASVSSSSADQVQSTSRNEDDEQLALALALSESESGKIEKLSGQEEDDLAKAMEESMTTQRKAFHTPPPAEFALENNVAAHNTGSTSWPASCASTYSTSPESFGTPASSERSWTSFHPPISLLSPQVSDDEAYARRLAAEEELAKTEQIERNVSDTEQPLPPPLYRDVVPSSSPAVPTRNMASIPVLMPTPPQSPPIPSSLPARSLESSISSHTNTPEPLPKLAGPSLSGSITTSTVGTSSRPIGTDVSYLDVPQRLGHSSQSIGADAYLNVPSRSSSISSQSMRGDTPLDGSVSPSRTPSPGLTSVGLSPPTSQSAGTSVDKMDSELSPPTPALASISANQFVDADLLCGVSLGFDGPSISTTLVPMQTAIPNVVSLPFGRCSPMHIMAPTWRHLLKLLARLSGTRVEPTVEAMAIAKVEMKLRVVIQFKKAHHLSSQWCTIIWLTIDNPPPSSTPNHWKYTSGDVNVLPWSYTLADLPAVLRDSADTQISKTYTIPSTTSTPYPSLPISFPNMAMYLQSALEESRKAAGDSSSGLRKLAKMVDLCYPSEPASCGLEGSDTPEKRTMGGLFKRVIGMKGGSKGGGGNQDTYELVTPFVTDGWG